MIDWEYWQFINNEGYPVGNALTREQADTLDELPWRFSNGKLYRIIKYADQAPFTTLVGVY